jgi:hypothetical protein
MGSLNHISIFQPFHDESAKQSIDPLAIPLDWLSNPRPELRETAVYFHLRNIQNQITGQYLGLFSPKYALKSIVPLKNFIAFAKDNPGYDVYFINPFPQIPYQAFNVWDQGEIFHPGLIESARQCFEAAAVLPSTCFDSRHDKKTALFCNFWIGTREFFNFFVDKLASIVKFADTDTSFHQSLFKETIHDLAGAPLFPFIAERLFSSIMAESDSISRLAYEYESIQILDMGLPGMNATEFLELKSQVDGWDRAASWSKEKREFLRRICRLNKAFADDVATRDTLPFRFKAN